MAEKEASAPTNSAAAATISSEIMVAAVIFLFMVVAFIFVLYLYAKRYVGANPALGRSRSRRRFVFATELAPRSGLHPDVLTALPVAAYRAENCKEGLECAVCLSEVSEGERIRLLPDCDHGFHVECIDMWFHSHSTCPLCRTLVTAQPDPAAGSAGIWRPQDVCGNGSSRESPALPTNVLFWGFRVGLVHKKVRRVRRALLLLLLLLLRERKKGCS
uniref:RING-type E3 ubiquitin transferase n=1 Tax=Ananas comosus var. bracteatus TaxID=296719 RepID=A0A6V7P9Q4_ANACO|nr:unnamed protein product [Ananas comosus var. bracteatus]